MEPSIVVALIAAVQIIYQGWTKYRSERNKIKSDANTSLAGVVDKRIQLILDNNARDLERLQRVDDELRDVLSWLRMNNIDWPPGGSNESKGAGREAGQ